MKLRQLSRLGWLALTCMVSACGPAALINPPAIHPAFASTAPQENYLPTGRLLFTSDRDGTAGDIYELRPESPLPTRLTSAAGFKNHARGAHGQNGLWLYEAVQETGTDIFLYADGQAMNLTAGPGDETSPDWSPENNRIVYASNRDLNWELYLQNLDGSSATRLTFSTANDQEPTWDPHSNTIAYTTNQDGRWSIILTNLDTMEARPLIPADTYVNNTMPAWSPDGSRMAFASSRDGNWEIYIINTDSSGMLRLTNDPGDDLSPTWSPDGTAIAFATNRDGNWEIYWMQVDGTAQLNLTNNPAVDQFPNWTN